MVPTIRQPVRAILRTMKDWYAILGVAPSASLQDIKRAYKRLVKERHPDIAAGDGLSPTAFHDIVEAYRIVGNASSRADYDRTRRSHRPAGHHPHRHRGPQPPLSRLDPFVHAFSAGPDRMGPFAGKRPERPFRADAGPIPPHTGKGPYLGTVSIPLALAIGGGRVELTVPGAGVIHLPVEPNTESGRVVPLPIANATPRVKILVESEPGFRVSGRSIEHRIELSLAEAVLGTILSLRLPGDRVVTVECPPGTQPHTTRIVKGQGLGGGDLTLVFSVLVPAQLSPEARRAFKTFACLAGITDDCDS